MVLIIGSEKKENVILTQLCTVMLGAQCASNRFPFYRLKDDSM
jgi:hypothetical protein